MAPSVSEAKDSIEESQQPDVTAPTVTTTEETKSASPSSTESSKQKKKKKKQRDCSSATAETQKAEDDKGDEKENGKANNNNNNNTTAGEKDSSTDAQINGKAEKESNVAPPSNDVSSGPVVSSTKRTRPPYKYDPEKVTLRFLFANRDGLTVTVECKPSDTVGEVKGQLLSVWPEDLQSCSNGNQLRLICMGKGMLAPDTRTLHNCEVPVFRTHPTPVNVAVRPKQNTVDSYKSGKGGSASGGGPSGGSNNRISEQSGQGCGCVIS